MDDTELLTASSEMMMIYDNESSLDANFTNDPFNGTNFEEDWFGYITEGILLTSISACGFIGNSLSVFVLLRSSLKGNFSYQLTSLAGYDALFLLAAIMTFGLPKISPEYRKQTAFLYMMPICYGLVHTFRVGSVLSTVSVTLERFFAIVFPLRDVTCIKRWLIPMSTAFTIIYNFPKFFEITFTKDPISDEYIMVGTALRQNQLYTSIYVVWSKLLLTDLFPYFTIAILNSFIIKKIIQSNQFRSRITSSVRKNRHTSNNDKESGLDSSETEEVKCFEKQRQEHKLGIMLIAVSVMFIVCQSFKMIPDLYEIIFCSNKEGACYTTPFVTTCLNLSHFLVCLNSSANFVIYLLAGEKFRRVWFNTYCLGCVSKEELERSGTRRQATICNVNRESNFSQKTLPTKTESLIRQSGPTRKSIVAHDGMTTSV